jgi:hypothetical protein
VAAAIEQQIRQNAGLVANTMLVGSPEDAAESD